MIKLHGKTWLPQVNKIWHCIFVQIQHSLTEYPFLRPPVGLDELYASYVSIVYIHVFSILYWIRLIRLDLISWIQLGPVKYDWKLFDVMVMTTNGYVSWKFKPQCRVWHTLR